MKRGEIRGGGGINCVRPDPSNSFTDFSYSQARWRCGLALVAEAGVFETSSIELGMFYNKYQFIRRISGLVVDERSNRVHVPLLFKFWLFRSLYFGAGGYASYLVGSVDSPHEISSDLRTSAFDTGEHGLEATLGGEWGVQKGKYFIRLEYRHNFSLTARSFEVRNFQNIFVSVLYPIKVSL